MQTTDLSGLGYLASLNGVSAFPVQSWQQVSEAYRSVIEMLGLGASQAPPCMIYAHPDSTIPVAHVSYNGKVWAGKPGTWREGMQPIWCP